MSSAQSKKVGPAASSRHSSAIIKTKRPLLGAASSILSKGGESYATRQLAQYSEIQSHCIDHRCGYFGNRGDPSATEEVD
jgi:hypothetical protein